MKILPRNSVITGDAYTELKKFPSASIDCVITSPPYFQLRDYGVAGQIGLERHVEEWVDSLRRVMKEVARVLKPEGSLWLNLGDSYSRGMACGAPAKSLVLAPERLLLALCKDGWIVRNKVVWAKANPMPTSISDRLNTSYDFVYFLTRSPRYFFDLDAIREPHQSMSGKRARSPVKETPAWAGPLAGTNNGLRRARPKDLPGHALGKNPGDVWRIATAGFKGAHFATFPVELVRRPLLATCPEKVCVSCNRAWVRRKSKTVVIGNRDTSFERGLVRRYPRRWEVTRKLGPLMANCRCHAGTRPGIVLDPFFGSGTVGETARKSGRDFIGIELNPAYVSLAKERLAQVEETIPLLDNSIAA